MVWGKVGPKTLNQTGSFVKRFLSLTLCLLLAACSKKEGSNTLKIAATPTPQAVILEYVKPKLEKEGVTLKIIQMNDYNLPNRALSEKEVDANFFQHIPFMDEQIKIFGYKIKCYARIEIEPMGLYSKKITSLKDLPEKATVAVPNDPTNEYRALALMEKEGIITLKPQAKLSATVASIATNPKNLVFLEVDAAMLPRSLPSVDLAAIPTNFALQAGLNPDKDALSLESKDSPYVNIIAIRDGTGDDPRLEKLRKVLLADDVRKFIEEKFEGAIIPILELCPGSEPTKENSFSG